jgi:hypothetical protein
LASGQDLRFVEFFGFQRCKCLQKQGIVGLQTSYSE